jgi:hypothetical protein
VSTLARPGFYLPHLAVGPDGTFHAVFNEGYAERIVYGSCRQSCGSEASWNFTALQSSASLGTSTVGPYGLGVDASGRLHLLLGAVAPMGSQANQLAYGTCAANCSSAASWSFVDVSARAPGHGVIGGNETLVVEPSGAVGFLTQGQPGAFPAAWVWCAGNCGSVSNWSGVDTPITGAPTRAVRDGAGVIHAAFYAGQSAAGDNVLQYARCAGNCGQTASWQVSPLGFLAKTNGWESGLSVSAEGRVYLAYNQGSLASPNADDRRLMVNSCAGANCLDLDAWTTLRLGGTDEGVAGTWLETTGTGVYVAAVAGGQLNLYGCDANCVSPAAWQAVGAVDTDAQMAASLPPALGSACPGTAVSAAWYPRLPRFAVGDPGLVLMHAPNALVLCPGATFPSSSPTVGRLVSTF